MKVYGFCAPTVVCEANRERRSHPAKTRTRQEEPETCLGLHPRQLGRPGHFVDVITNGYGAMYSYNDRIPPDDRWAIAAYIRVLQLSQSAPMEALNDAEKSQVMNVKQEGLR